MNQTRAKALVALLIRNNLIDEKQRKQLGKSVALQGSTITMAIFEHTKIPEKVLNRAMAKVYSLKTVEPEQFQRWDPKRVKIGQAIIDRYPIAMLAKKDRTWIAACSDPDDERLHSDLPALLKGSIELRVVSDVRLAWMRANAYGIDGNIRLFSLFSRLAAMPKTANKPLVPEQASQAQQVQALTLDGSMEDRDDGADLIDEAAFAEIYMQDRPGSAGFEPSIDSPTGESATNIEVEPVVERQQTSDVEQSSPMDAALSSLDADEDAIEAAIPVIENVEPVVPLEVEPPEEEVVEEAIIEPLTRDEAIAALAEARSRDDLAQVLLGFARNQFERALLVSVDADHVVGWAGAGRGIEANKVDAIWFGLDQESVFKTVVTTQSHYIGPIADNPVHKRLVGLLGDEQPSGVFVMPLLYDGEVSQMLWLDNGHEQPAGYDISDILILAVRVPAALDAIVQAAQAELA